MYTQTGTKTATLERHKYLDDEEVYKLTNYITNRLAETHVTNSRGSAAQHKQLALRDTAWLYLMFAAGLRITESIQALKANLHAIDPTTLELTIRSVKKRNNKIVHRTIPITDPKAVEVITAQAQASQATTIINSTHGGPPTPRTMQTHWKNQIQPALKLKHNQTPHALRHTFALRYYRTTKDIHGLSQMLGHETLETTMIYIHSTTQELTERTRQVAKANANQAQQQTINIHLPQQLPPTGAPAQPEAPHAPAAQPLEAPLHLLGQVERWLMDNAEQAEHPTWQQTLKLLRSMQNR